MIHLLNESREHIENFNSYGELADYIHKKELSRTRMLASMTFDWMHLPPNLEEEWSFVVYTHESLKTTYATMRNPPLTEIEWEAFERGLDLIEIHYGNARSRTQILVTGDVDIESLQKDWCLAYGKAHDYIIEETGTNTAGGKDDLAL